MNKLTRSGKATLARWFSSSSSSATPQTTSAESSRVADAKANISASATSTPPPVDARKRTLAQRQVTAGAAGSWSTQPDTGMSGSEGVNESSAPEKATKMGPIKAQSAAIARAMASICNAEWPHLGGRSGCGGFVHTFSGDGKRESKAPDAQAPYGAAASPSVRDVFKKDPPKDFPGMVEAAKAAARPAQPSADLRDRVAALQRWADVGQAVAELRVDKKAAFAGSCEYFGANFGHAFHGKIAPAEAFAIGYGFGKASSANWMDRSYGFSGFSDAKHLTRGFDASDRWSTAGPQSLEEHLFLLSHNASRTADAASLELHAQAIRGNYLSADAEALIDESVPQYGAAFMGVLEALKDSSHDEVVWSRLMRWPCASVFRRLNDWTEERSAEPQASPTERATRGTPGAEPVRVHPAGVSVVKKSDSEGVLDNWNASKVAGGPFVRQTLFYGAYEERLDRLLADIAQQQTGVRLAAQPMLNRHLALIEGELEAIPWCSFSEPDKDALRSHMVFMHGKLSAAIAAADVAETKGAGAAQPPG